MTTNTYPIGVKMPDGSFCRKWPEPNKDDVIWVDEMTCSICNETFSVKGLATGSMLFVCHPQGFWHYFEKPTKENVFKIPTPIELFPEGPRLARDAIVFAYKEVSRRLHDEAHSRKYTPKWRATLEHIADEFDVALSTPVKPTIEERVHNVGTEIGSRMGLTSRDFLSVTGKKDDSGPAQIIIVQYAETYEKAVENLERLVGMRQG